MNAIELIDSVPEERIRNDLYLKRLYLKLKKIYEGADAPPLSSMPSGDIIE